MTGRCRLLAPAVLVVGACRAAAPTQARLPVPGHEARARTAIARQARALSDGYMRGDAQAIVALYLPGGLLLPPSAGLVQGEAALLRAWTLRPGTRVVAHRTQADSVIVVGPVAYDWGTYHWRMVVDDGTERTQRGRYVIVWREAQAGVWKMHVDMWNAAPATAGAPAATRDSVTLRIDYAGAEALVAALERDSLTDGDLDALLRVRGVRTMVDNVTRYIPRLGRPEFRQAVRAFARTKRSAAEYRPFALEQTWARRAQVRALVAATRRDEREVLRRTLTALAPYRPPAGPLALNAYLIAGGVSTGIAPDTPDDPAFYANLTRAEGDYDGLLWNIAHETYHLMQKAALRRVPGLAAVADTLDGLPPTERLLATVLLEGTADLATDPRRLTGGGPELVRQRARFDRNLAAPRVRENFAVFDTLFHGLRAREVTWEELYRRGFAGEARFYAVGYGMAHAIERHGGAAAVRRLFARPPVDFFREYVRIYREHPEIVGRFAPETERALGVPPGTAARAGASAPDATPSAVLAVMPNARGVRVAPPVDHH